MSQTIYEIFKTKFRQRMEEFVDICVIDRTTMLSYIMTYKILDYPKVMDDDIHVYNYITEVKERIKLQDILSIEYCGQGESEEWHVERINKLRNREGWDRENWGLLDVDLELKSRFDKKYFLCFDGSRITPEEAYLLVKLDVDNMEALHTIPLESLKNKWKNIILEQKQKAKKMLELERLECQNNNEIDDVQEINVILSLLSELDNEIDTEIQTIDTRNKLLSYWPPLLLPAPAYVELTYE